MAINRMNIKKKFIVVLSVCLFVMTVFSGVGFAYSSYTGTIPTNGGLVTPDVNASGSTQGIRVTFSENNTTLRGAITDTAVNELTSYQNLTINQWHNFNSGASVGQPIKARLTTAWYQGTRDINFDVEW